MNRIERHEDVIDLGDARVETKGVLDFTQEIEQEREENGISRD